MTINRWLALALLFLARTAMGFQFQSLGAVSPLLMRDLGIEFALLGTLVGIWMLPGAFVAVPGGALGHRFGEKRMVVLGLGLMALGTLMIAMAGTYEAVFAGRLVSGIGAVIVNVLLTKMAADWFADRELSTAMGLLVVSWPLGIGVALVALGPLAAASSWAVAMHVTLGVCIVAFVGIALGYRSPARAASATASSSRLSARELGLVSLAGIVWALFNVAYILVVSFVPALLSQRGMPPAHSALLVSLSTWPVVLTAPLGGMLADRTGRPNALIYGSFAGMAISMWLMLGVDKVWLMLLAFGLLAGPCAGPIMALPAKVLRPDSRALGMGVYYTWYYVGMAVLPPAAGYVRDATGLFAAPLLFGCALLVLGAIAFYVFVHLAGAGKAAGAFRTRPIVRKN
jgi:MFS family permease